MYMRHPDFSNMSQEELTTFLETTELSEMQKSIIKKASDKNRSYSTIMNYRAISRAREDIFDARLLLRKHGIFLPDDLRKKTEDILEVLSKAQIERYMDSEGRGASSNLDGITVLIRDGA